LLLVLCFKIVSRLITERKHARRAAELGCKPPFQRPYKYPFGIDMATRIMKAGKLQIVPNEMHEIFLELGHATFEQNFLGRPNFMTSDPKNIQAILATKFNDFEIGEARIRNFFPMLGKGIFTSNGKNWFVLNRSSILSKDVLTTVSGSIRVHSFGRNSHGSKWLILHRRRSTFKTCSSISQQMTKVGQKMLTSVLCSSA
jgi:hypothetical protein